MNDTDVRRRRCANTSKTFQLLNQKPVLKAFYVAILRNDLVGNKPRNKLNVLRASFGLRSTKEAISGQR